MKKWDRLTRHEDKYAQCPYTILFSDLVSDKALRLYLVLWWKAFVGKKYNQHGQQYVDMSYTEICELVHCNRNKAVELVNELKNNNLVHVRRKSKNQFTFTRKDEWFKEDNNNAKNRLHQ